MAKIIPYDVVIIGSGVVGLSAGVYCGRLGLNTIVIGKETGGTITKTHVVENYPGIKSLSGIGLAKKFMDHAKQYEIKIYSGTVSDISKNKTCFVVKTKKTHYHAKAIIFATGSKWRKLGVLGEEKYSNKGVSYCVLCDGPLFRDKIVAVAGGGDSAVKEALLLAKYAKQIYVIARSKLKPEPINLKRLKKEKKITVIEETTIKEIRGGKFVEKIILDKKFKGSNVLKLDGVFVDVGHVPLSELAKKVGVKTNKAKEIIIDRESKTNVAGFYAAGDVADSKFKQAITGVGEAVKAVYGIYEYLKGERIMCNCVEEK